MNTEITDLFIGFLILIQTRKLDANSTRFVEDLATNENYVSVKRGINRSLGEVDVLVDVGL